MADFRSNRLTAGLTDWVAGTLFYFKIPNPAISPISSGISSTTSLP